MYVKYVARDEPRSDEPPSIRTAEYTDVQIAAPIVRRVIDEHFRVKKGELKIGEATD